MPHAYDAKICDSDKKKVESLAEAGPALLLYFIDECLEAASVAILLMYNRLTRLRSPGTRKVQTPFCPSRIHLDSSSMEPPYLPCKEIFNSKHEKHSRIPKDLHSFSFPANHDIHCSAKILTYTAPANGTAPGLISRNRPPRMMIHPTGCTFFRSVRSKPVLANILSDREPELIEQQQAVLLEHTSSLQP